MYDSLSPSTPSLVRTARWPMCECTQVFKTTLVVGDIGYFGELALISHTVMNILVQTSPVQLSVAQLSALKLSF